MKFAISAAGAAVIAVVASASTAATTAIDDTLINEWKNGIPQDTINTWTADTTYQGTGSEVLTMIQNSEVSAVPKDAAINYGTQGNVTIENLDQFKITGTGDSTTWWQAGIAANSNSKTITVKANSIEISGVDTALSAINGSINVEGNDIVFTNVGSGVVSQYNSEAKVSAKGNLIIKATGTALASKSYGTDPESQSHTLQISAQNIQVETSSTQSNALRIDSTGSAVVTAQESASFTGANGLSMENGGTFEITAPVATFSTNKENGSAISMTGTASATFNGGTIIANGDIQASDESTIAANNTRFELQGDSDFIVNNMLQGENVQIVVNSTKSQVHVETNKVNGLSAVASGAFNDQFASAQEARDALNNLTTVGEGTIDAPSNPYRLAGEAGSTSDAWFIDEKGLHSSMNASLSVYRDFNAATLAQWRNESNHLTQRLGNVRRNLGTAGAWARVYGYDGTVKKDANIDIKANSVQVGADTTVSGNWIVGGAFSYTNMDGNVSNGSSESDGYSLAAYASGFFDCGGYVDVVGRVGRLRTDLDASTLSATGGSLTSSYDNTTFGLSAEVGYHWNLSEVFYAEPQLELAYGYVLGDDFQSAGNDAKVEQDDFQSLVGRLGAQLGANFPNNAGRFYVEASVNYDFLGDADSTISNRYGVKRSLNADLGGTWFTYGVGMDFYASDALSIYGSLDRSSGNAYEESYRYSVGARYVF